VDPDIAVCGFDFLQGPQTVANMSSDASFENHARSQETALTAAVRIRWYILHRTNWTLLPTA
jgi:hypothetical protein